MKIYNSIKDFNPDFNVVLTLGTFDGVHIGHQSIIKQLNEVSSKIGGESVLLTFYPHPQHVLFPEDHKLKLLTTIEERSKILENFGLKHLIVQEFNPLFSRIKAVNFVRDFLVNRLKVKQLIIGYDHHFGRNREGNYDELVKWADLYNYQIEKIDPRKYNNVSVSSTKIRKLINENNFSLANHFLGYNFFLEGKVVKGKENGTKIGYPTANLVIENKWKLIPNDGVYAVKIKYYLEEYTAMLNIGFNPTFNNGERTIEAHILDFNKQIYGELIKISFIKRIRDEKKFNSIKELINRINIDENIVRKLLK